MAFLLLVAQVICTICYCYCISYQKLPILLKQLSLSGTKETSSVYVVMLGGRTAALHNFYGTFWIWCAYS